jgi:ketosteroid isomerase-like protein
MLRSVLIVGLALVLGVSFAVVAQKRKESERTKTRRELVEMEHAFAKAAATKGTRDAFIEFLADDGIVFQPGPVNGKKFWTGRERRKGLLSWEPEYADVSRAGDLGWTTGPWEFRPNGPEDKPVALGEYFTIWKKQSDGSWKAILDRGVSADKSYATRLLQFPRNDEASDSRAKANFALLREKLMKVETDFSAAATKKGAVNAYDLYLAEDVRMLRADLAPALGKQRALEVISSRLGTLSWQPTVADVSSSGDLGYTYGTFEFKSRGVLIEHGSYVRVWKKIGRAWQVVMDVSSPDPAQ